LERGALKGRGEGRKENSLSSSLSFLFSHEGEERKFLKGGKKAGGGKKKRSVIKFLRFPY